MEGGSRGATSTRRLLCGEDGGDRGAGEGADLHRNVRVRPRRESVQVRGSQFVYVVDGKSPNTRTDMALE